MFGEFQKLQKICNKMSTRIFKIDGEMPEIIEPKVGKPQNSTNQNLANLSKPWNLTFLEDEIFQVFFNQMTQKYQNEKSPILNSQKMSKISEEVQKIRDLEEPTVFRPFENTLYTQHTNIQWRRSPVELLDLLVEPHHPAAVPITLTDPGRSGFPLQGGVKRVILLVKTKQRRQGLVPGIKMSPFPRLCQRYEGGGITPKAGILFCHLFVWSEFTFVSVHSSYQLIILQNFSSLCIYIA